MGFSEIFIRRPVMTTLVMLAILLFGMLGYSQLPVNDLPNVDFPTLQVSASLPGASPETMAATVATPLERQFSAIPGLESMNSTSTLGSTQITLQFDLNRKIDAAAQDVQSAIAAASGQLPPTLPTPPSLRKVNPADAPILLLALSSPTLPISQVDEYAQTLIAQRLSMVGGVAQIQVYGSQKYAVRVQIDPNALASRGIGVDEVAAAIRQGNSNLPTGTLNGEYRTYTIESNGQLTNAAAYRRLTVATRNGVPVHLEELARVIDSVENDRAASWFNRTRAIVLAVQRQPGVNTIQVVDGIRRLLPELSSQLPAAMRLQVLFDRSVSIRASVDDVQFTLFLSIGLVVLVIFLFLRNLSATIIPSLALPLSIVATFGAMYLLGFSLNNLSLIALTLAVGFVVDDAIVVLENIVRHQEMGEDPLTAAVNGAREIGFTILSMTLSLVAVFIPILFMGGLLGRLFNEFAVTISVSILVSGFVSLTLTPMLAGRFLKPIDHQVQAANPLWRATEAVFDAALGLYERTLTVALAWRRLTLALFFATLGLTWWLYQQVPRGFIPSEDTGQIVASTEAVQGISFADMLRHQQRVVDVIAKHPAIEAFNSTVGAGGPNGASNFGRVFIRLKPREQRKSAEEVIRELRPKLAGIPGIRVFPQIPPSIRIGGLQTRALYQFALQSPDTETLYRVVPLLEARFKELPELQDVNSDLQLKNPQLNIEIDRERAAALAVSAEQIEQTLASTFGTSYVSLIYTSTNQYRVILTVEPRYQFDPGALSLLYVRSASGRLVPLSEVARLRVGVGPVSVSHLGQFTAATLSFNLKPGVSLGEATARIEALAREVVPAEVSTSFQGSAQAFQSSVANLGLLLAVAVLVIYIVLGVLYESFIHPLTILSGLPSAGLGALLTLLIFGKELDVYGFVGLILLVGIVKKNAIMMIDFALEAERLEGKTPDVAITSACLVRFRPIMMTTLAALMGTLPIALGFGAAAESRQPLGLAVVGGLLVSQLITLYITPVIYLYLDPLQKRLEGRRSNQATPNPVAAE
jgi:HAE1 family hydrophobic/amphiphilic exporter-1